jgi:hypothetical protein
MPFGGKLEFIYGFIYTGNDWQKKGICRVKNKE